MKKTYRMTLTNNENETILTSYSKISSDKCFDNFEKHRKDENGNYYEKYYFGRIKYFINDEEVSDRCFFND